MSENNPAADIPLATPRAKAPHDQKHIAATATSDYTAFDAALQNQLVKDFVDQTTLMNDLAKALLKLQIAIPALFAAVLKLVAGKDAVLLTSVFPQSLWVITPFLLWLLAMAFTLIALNPGRYQIDPNLLKATLRQPNRQTATDVYSLYQHSAANKFLYVTGSSVLTMVGLLIMVLSLLAL